MDRVNTTTWILDATNGSRHSLTEAFTTGGMYFLRNKGGRTDITAANVLAQYKVALSSNFLGGQQANPGYYEAVTYRFGVILTASPQWKTLA